MELLVERGDFPLTESWSYLNAANVALIPMRAATVIAVAAPIGISATLAALR